VPSGDGISTSAAANHKLCFFCGRSYHLRIKCPAKNATCHKCGKSGHFSNVCKGFSNITSKPTSAAIHHIAHMSAATSGNSSASITISVNGSPLNALVDSGSSTSFIDLNTAKRLSIRLYSSSETIHMASLTFSASTAGHCVVDIVINGYLYKEFKLSLLPNLCSDVILGRNFMQLHESVEFQSGGSIPKLSVCAVTSMMIEPPSLFGNLSADCRPVSTPSRKHNRPDELFIKNEIQNLLREGIIEKSQSPWRAQVLVTSEERHKRRMVVDYSRTINRFTELDAYPIPQIHELVRNLAQYRVYSKLDLESAYYQVPIKESEKKYMAFEADGQIFHFNRVPFGLTNAVAVFQRTMNDIIRDNDLQGTFAYIDDVIVCGRDTEEHNTGLRKFNEVATKYKLTLNSDKCRYNMNEVSYLGYLISNGSIKPGPERLQPLRQLPEPHDPPSLQRTLGMLAYYSQWIPNYSKKELNHF